MSTKVANQQIHHNVRQKPDESECEVMPIKVQELRAMVIHNADTQAQILGEVADYRAQLDIEQRKNKLIRDKMYELKQEYELLKKKQETSTIINTKSALEQTELMKKSKERLEKIRNDMPQTIKHLRENKYAADIKAFEEEFNVKLY